MAPGSEVIELRSGVRINTIITQPFKGPSESGRTTIVFLHFWGGSANTWSLVTPLVSEAYQTVAVDFRGWGASAGPDDRSAYSIATLADDVEEVIAALHLDAVVLVGLSMGAKVAQLVAGRMSSRATGNPLSSVLRGLVLVSPAPATPLELPQDMREQQLHAYDHEDSAAFVATNVLTATFRDKALPDFVVRDMLRGNKWAREAWPAYSMAEDVSGATDSIAVPVLVLAALEDQVEPLERVREEVCSRLQGANLEILTRSGHLSPLDKPAEVAEHLLKFVARL